MSKTTLFIFRHGETSWNAEGRFQGHTNVPLNEKGHKQATELSRMLVRFKLNAIFSSDLERALQTAKPAAEILGIPIHATEHLREAHLGQAEGLLVSEIHSRFGMKMADQWRSYDPSFLNDSYPNGETGRAVISRVFGSLEKLLHTHSYERVGLSTHGGVIRRMFQKFLIDKTPGYFQDPVAIPNSVLYVAEYDRTTRSWSIPATLPFE